MTEPRAAALDNATDIIDRFGGIRPMASKMGVAVTTVQGWKKRGTIPANRVQALLESALEHDIDITDLVEIPGLPREESSFAPSAEDSASPSNTTNTQDHLAETDQEEKTVTASDASAQPHEHHNEHDAAPSVVASMLHDDLIHMIIESEKRAVTKSTWTTVILILIAGAALLLLLLPSKKPMSEEARQAELARMEALENELNSMKDDMADMKDRQGFFGQVIPQDLNEKLAAIQEQAAQAQAGAQNVLNDVQSLSQSVSQGDVSALENRVKGLESQLGKIENIPMMSALTDRYSAFTKTAGGQDLLEKSTAGLSTLIPNISGQSDEAINEALDQARQEDEALGQSLEGVPQKDLKAAALLMTMTQLRGSLNRNGEAFDGDLEVLKNLVGEDDPELIASIDRLAPHAASGVLTPSGLSNELKSMTGEIVVASLKGEDVSLKEKAQARLNNIFKLEKDGELVTGTPTQAKIQETERLLEAGDVQGAIALMQSLDGDAASVAAPWLDQARASLLADQMKSQLSRSMSAKAGGLTASGKTSGAQLIRDPESGFMVLKR